MDHLQQLRSSLRQYMFGFILLENALLILVWWAIQTFTDLSPLIGASASLAVGLVGAAVIATIATSYVTQPLQAFWQAVLHLSPSEQGYAAPDLKKLKFGRELVTGLAAQMNQLVSVSQKTSAETSRQQRDPAHNFVAQNLPLPLLLLDDTETITFANAAAAGYIGTPAKDMMGKNVYMVLDMSFPNKATFDAWLKEAKTKNATTSNSWERVRLNVRDNHPALLFDLAAFYNKGNPDKIETMLTLFDHTKQYSQDEQAVSFIALTVHELRTPLTLLRGYIEVFEEELGDTISPDMRGFMQKMRSQAEQLTSFVNNILNVARIDDDQLELKLEEANWSETLKASVAALSLRAKVRGISLRCRLATDLPSVGIDRLSVQEVINNLIDNAIKYSGDSKVINIETRLTKEGLIETTVQDSGLGISSSIMPKLFTKFYRDHRNRAQIGGTGLGLYLSKAIIDAHGGSIWVRSKEGEGSTFGFTLLPYAQIAKAQQSGDKGIARSAHSWIKNHSLYSR